MYSKNIIGEFVGLKARMHSLITVDGGEMKKQKESIKRLLKV